MGNRHDRIFDTNRTRKSVYNSNHGIFYKMAEGKSNKNRKFYRYRVPKVIQSDQGIHFVNEVIKELTKKFQVKYSLSSPYHSQSNGLVKRFNQTLCKGLVKLEDSI